MIGRVSRISYKLGRLSLLGAIGGEQERWRRFASGTATCRTSSEFVRRIARWKPGEQTNDVSAWIHSNISQFSSFELLTVFNAYTAACASGYLLDPSEASALITELKVRACFPSSRTSEALLNASKLTTYLSRAGVELLPVMQAIAVAHINSRYLQMQTLCSVSSLLQAFVNVCPPLAVKSTLFPTKSGVELMTLIETEMTKVLFKANEDDTAKWAVLLRWVVTIDRCSEDFIRALEMFVFGHLRKMGNKEFAEILIIYFHRITFDYFYIHTSIFHHYGMSFAARIPHLPAPILTSICHNLWAKSNRYGLYCDGSIVEALKSVVNNEFWVRKWHGREIIECIQSVVTYLVNAGHFRTVGLFDRAVEIVVKQREHACDLTISKLGVAFARAQYVNEEFWGVFKERFPQMVQNEAVFESIYMILLNLRTFAPDLHQSLTEIPMFTANSSVISEYWKEKRLTEGKTAMKSWLHRKTAEYLRKNGYEFEEEYYDEFCIDIALVRQKVALEVCGTSHYVLPSQTLDGRMQARKAILEHLGWKVVILPFLYQRNEGFDEIISSELRKYLAAPP